jgi:hypothetical protein
MSRDCNIPQSLGDNPYQECQFINVEDIKREVRECAPVLEACIRGTMAEAANWLASISQLPVWSAFFDFCGCPHGIFLSFMGQIRKVAVAIDNENKTTQRLESLKTTLSIQWTLATPGPVLT